ncbi:MAG: hypothetical protein BZY88_09515 [SAR202 cluster bacterium Io17-Chloro-G9]|nr:MAG: hypothetical protein BZY88_09515 [SAR202 cluster bacterium Io17-Chloro-G9]
MKGLQVEIRPILHNELPLIEKHLDFDWGNPGKHGDRLVRQHIGTVVYLVAWLASVPVGHVLIVWDGCDDEPMRSGDEPMRSGLAGCPNLEDAVVAPQHRSKGIGSRLLDTAEALARQNGFSRIGLGVALDNPRAQTLYERQGYRNSGFNEYTTRGRYIDRDGQEQFWEETCNYLIKQVGRDESD